MMHKKKRTPIQIMDRCNNIRDYRKKLADRSQVRIGGVPAHQKKIDSTDQSPFIQNAQTEFAL